MRGMMIEVMTKAQYNELLLKDAYELLMKAKNLVELNESYCQEAETLIDKAEEKLQTVCDSFIQLGFDV